MLYSCIKGSRKAMETDNVEQNIWGKRKKNKRTFGIGRKP